jgi:hypothetical protein
MNLDTMLNLIIILFGIFSVVRFRKLGRAAIKQRKNLNRILPFPQSEKNFDEFSIYITQGLFLVIGIVFILVGVAKLLT